MSDQWASPAASSDSSGAVADYRPMGLFSKVLLGLLVLEFCLMAAVAVLDPLVTLVFPESLDNPEGFGLVLLGLLGISGIGLVLVLVVALPLWVYWHYRAGANLRALGREMLQYTPGWHAGWWFVPFANLVMPYRATHELWRASLPDAEYDGDNWVMAPEPSFFNAWWACWILGNILQNIGNRVPDLQIASIIGLVSSPIALAALGMYIWIVKTVSENQDALADRLSKQG